MLTPSWDYIRLLLANSKTSKQKKRLEKSSKVSLSKQIEQRQHN